MTAEMPDLGTTVDKATEADMKHIHKRQAALSAAIMTLRAVGIHVEAIVLGEATFGSLAWEMMRQRRTQYERMCQAAARSRAYGVHANDPDPAFGMVGMTPDEVTRMQCMGVEIIPKPEPKETHDGTEGLQDNEGHRHTGG